VRLVSLAVVALPLLRPAALGNATPADLFILVALAAATAWAGLTAAKVGVPYLVPVALTVIAGGAAAVHGGLPTDLATTVPLVQDVWLLLWAAALFNVLRDHRTVRTVLRTWAVSGIGWAGLLLVGVFTGQAFITGVSDRTGQRVALTLGDSNYAANYFLVSMLIAVACGYPRARRWRWLGCALMLWAIVLTGSNGGILGTAMSLGALAVISTRRTFGMMFAVALACSLVFGTLVQIGDCGDRALLTRGGGLCVVHLASLERQAKASNVKVIADGVGRASQSTSQRGELLEESKSVFRSSSLWGIGPTQVKRELARRQVPFVKEAHNDYVAALIERGVLGALALVVLIGAVVLRSLPTVNAGLRPSYVEVLPRPEALVCAVLVMALAGWFYEILHLRHLWALLALLAAIGHWGAAAPADAHSDEVPSAFVPISRTHAEESTLP
jgi:hypothetical protein